MTREQLRRAAFGRRMIAASNGWDRFESPRASPRQGWLGLALLYGLAIYGGIRFVTDVAMPFIAILIPR